MAQFQQRVFSGVQPTGNLHLGNYLGAIKRFVAMQSVYDCIYCVVDMHAITLPQDPAELRHQIREVTAAFIAAGIDPKKHIVFNQSQVSEHAELAWVFNCVARVGWANRMTQFKEKAGKDRENASIGLYAYPDAHGGRHPGLPGNPRARRRGPEAAPRADPRHRPEIQQRLGRLDRRARLRGCVLSAHRAAYPGSGDADHVACATARRRCRNPTRPTIRASI